MVRLNLEQRKLLRNWVHAHPSPKPSQRDCIAWVKRNFNVDVNQPQISRYLSQQNSHLDDLAPDDPKFALKKYAEAQWPVLEKILFRWQVEMEIRGLSTSRELLQLKAHELWQRFPEARNYEDITINPPSFGNTWLALFQKRYHIKWRHHHGEAASAQMVASLPETQQEIDEIKIAMAAHKPSNRYNMDQSGLFWRRTASSGLSSQARPGRKLNKSRISIACTINDTGDDRFQLWIVGKAAVPHALRGYNFAAQKLVWRHNQKAWFTTSIMEDWFQAFYRYIQATKPGQKVLLLLDNFLPHRIALQLMPPPPEITVLFFPANTTSIYQPCDQGVISNLKIFYRRSYLLWICQRLELAPQEDPVKYMNLRLAVSWIAEHWFHTVKRETVHNCWKKSTLIPATAAFQGKTIEVPTDLPKLYSQASTSVQDRMALSQFLNPEDENQPPDDPQDADGIMEAVAADFIQQEDFRDPEEAEAEDAQVKDNLVTPSEGLVSLLKLLNLAEDVPCFTAEDLRQLRIMRDNLQLWVSSNSIQGTLDGWLTKIG